jgi:GTP-binding protein HflX
VGFIDRLPHALVAAFRATLEEVVEADLLLHVIDAAGADRDRHVAAVRRVLEEVGAADTPILDVYNKIDTISPDECRRILDRNPEAAVISARSKEGVGDLLRRVAVGVALDTRRVTMVFDSTNSSDQRRIGEIYRNARVVSHVATEGHVVIEADVPRREISRLTHVTDAALTRASS